MAKQMCYWDSIHKIKRSRSTRGKRSARSAFTYDEVRIIIKKKLNGARCCECYEEVKNKISKGGFGKIWCGINYKKIWREFDE